MAARKRKITREINHLASLRIQVTPTADGLSTYVQISSPGAIPVNIVLIADHVEVCAAPEYIAKEGF